MTGSMRAYQRKRENQLRILMYRLYTLTIFTLKLYSGVVRDVELWCLLLYTRGNPPHDVPGVEVVLHHLRPRRRRCGHRPAGEVDVHEAHRRCELDPPSLGRVDELFGSRHQLRLDRKSVV